MKRGAAIIAILVLLAGCKGMGLSSMNNEGPETPPGLSSFNTETKEEQAEAKWFDDYYGGSHGYGWSNSAPDSANCDFWSTCKDDGAKPNNSLGW